MACEHLPSIFCKAAVVLTTCTVERCPDDGREKHIHADRVAPRVAVSIASIYNMETPPAVAELLSGLDLEDVSSIVNLETWQRLSPADPAPSSPALLPSASAAGDGSVETLLATEVFTLSNRRFGSPLSHFLEAFQSGHSLPKRLPLTLPGRRAARRRVGDSATSTPQCHGPQAPHAQEFVEAGRPARTQGVLQAERRPSCGW